MSHRRRRGRLDGPLVPLDGVNRIAGVEIRLRQHGAGAESMTRRSRRHLERFHRLFLHAHVDVGRGHLEVLLRRFRRRVVRAVVPQALQHVLDRRSRARRPPRPAASSLLRNREERRSNRLRATRASARCHAARLRRAARDHRRRDRAREPEASVPARTVGSGAGVGGATGIGVISAPPGSAGHMKSVLVNGDWPLNRSAMMASISVSPSSASARRNRSMFDRSHGSRATRSSAITRASAPAPTVRYASASCACALCMVASRPPSTQISTSRISAGM